MENKLLTAEDCPDIVERNIKNRKIISNNANLMIQIANEREREIREYKQKELEHFKNIRKKKFKVR